MIQRFLEQKIIEKLDTGKAILLIGPRQVGKTTLIQSLLKNKAHLFLNGDDPSVRNLLNQPNTEELKSILGRHTIVFIDEEQRIENIGITLKLITDQFKTVQLLVSGSSAFELNDKINEPLTGRKWEFALYPTAWEELEQHLGFVKAQQQLELRLLYGMYPDVINNPGSEIEILTQLTNSYLYKDLLAFGGIRKPEVLEKLVKALALQIGAEVSYNELAQLIGVDKNTISSYINLLIQGCIIFKLPSYSNNLRNEIKTNQKIYFYDTGIRNRVIGNFNPIEERSDKGALWENFLISERFKKKAYHQSLASSYFWRTKQQKEIDYVEEQSGQISGFEFKWNPNAKLKNSKTFTETYNAAVKFVHRENFRSFLMP